MTQTPTIEREDATSHGAYRASVAGSDQHAELTWTARGNARIADHTFVPPEARGQGLAKYLVEALVTDAKAQGFKIVPQCSYVAAAFRQHPEWSDLLAETSR